MVVDQRLDDDTPHTQPTIIKWKKEIDSLRNICPDIYSCVIITLRNKTKAHEDQVWRADTASRYLRAGAAMKKDAAPSFSQLLVCGV